MLLSRTAVSKLEQRDLFRFHERWRFIEVEQGIRIGLGPHHRFGHSRAGVAGLHLSFTPADALTDWKKMRQSTQHVPVRRKGVTHPRLYLNI